MTKKELIITLKSDGTVESIDKDFLIQRGSINNGDLIVKVPISLVQSEENKSTLVRIGAIINTSTGEKKQTKRYELERQQNSEENYVSYKRILPKDFTSWRAISPYEDINKAMLQIIINIVNTTTVTQENEQIKIYERIVASPIVSIPVEASTYLTDREFVELDDFDKAKMDIEELQSKLEVEKNRLDDIDLSNYAEKTHNHDTRYYTTDQSAMLFAYKSSLEEVSDKVNDLDLIVKETPRALAFPSYFEMFKFLQNAEEHELNIGQSLFVEEPYTPDFWVCGEDSHKNEEDFTCISNDEILERLESETELNVGYYWICPLESKTVIQNCVDEDTFNNEVTILNAKIDGKADIVHTHNYASTGHTHSNATTTKDGFMSSSDKATVEAIKEILGSEEDSDTVVNKINEVLAVFENYPEGDKIAEVLANKSNVGHTHEISHINELQSVLDAKSPIGHTHDNYATKTELATKLDKLTYEWNKTISFGSSGCLYLGRFKVYDSNITIDISSTTSTTYNGKLVLATQNGTIRANSVYNDASNTLAPNIYIKEEGLSSSQQWLQIYFVPSAWSKNIIRISALGIESVDTICTNVASKPTDATVQPTNVLTTSFAQLSHTHEISNVNGLQNALNGKASSGHTHSTYAPTDHNHNDLYYTKNESIDRFASKQTENLIKEKQFALAFSDYDSLATMFNSLTDYDSIQYRTGQSVYIIDTGVPDLWIHSVSNDFVLYTYNGDEDFINELDTYEVVQIGFVNFAKLETFKQDLQPFDRHIEARNNPHSVTKSQVGLSNVANERQYSASNPPPYPLKSTSTGLTTNNGVISVDTNYINQLIDAKLPPNGNEVNF